MMDSLSAKHRSWNMSRIRGSNTRPEIKLRSMLHRSGYRFRVNVKNLPGKPDIVLPKYKTIIFLHGCFWHRHSNCRYAYTPKTRQAFWLNKFKANASRDKKVNRSLRNLGWQIVIVWECEMKAPRRVLSRIVDQLK